MLAVAKTPRIDLRIEGDIPERVLLVLREEYGNIEVMERDNDEDLVNALETDWYRETEKNTSPGDMLQIMRWKRQISQAALAGMTGIPRQNISAMEKGRRPIGWRMAVKLAKALACDPRELCWQS